jgi:hypothetical protein
MAMEIGKKIFELIFFMIWLQSFIDRRILQFIIALTWSILYVWIERDIDSNKNWTWKRIFIRIFVIVLMIFLNFLYLILTEDFLDLMYVSYIVVMSHINRSI